MTLPASGPISIAQVATELGLSATGLSLNHPWVRALAQQLSGGVSMSSLRGQSGNFNGLYSLSTGQPTLFFGGGGISGGISQTSNGNGTWTLTAQLQPIPPDYTGNIIIFSSSTGNSAVLSYFNVSGSVSWQNSSAPQVFTSGNNSITIYPHV